MAKQNGVIDETVWLSVKQAAAYSNRKQSQVKRGIEKSPAIFDANNHRTRLVHEDYPPLEEVTQTSLDAWLEAQMKQPNRGGRKPNPNGAIWKQPIPADRYDEFVALVTNNGFAAPYKPAASKRTKKVKVDTVTESAPISETFDADLIEA